ncbi:uncharacterized protein [Coffea arabica]|uniref:ATP-dependent DNA helicase n=1 Tax=Coffea arabica TaxID=13443 RepID=A0A6P6XBN8_COFAR|nr:uncharacterized protein LOC113740982 [Coffea arabica]
MSSHEFASFSLHSHSASPSREMHSALATGVLGEHPLVGTPNLRNCQPTSLHGKRKSLGSRSFTAMPDLRLFNKKNRSSASVSVIDELTNSLETPYCDKEILPMNNLFENFSPLPDPYMDFGKNQLVLNDIHRELYLQKETSISEKQSSAPASTSQGIYSFAFFHVIVDTSLAALSFLYIVTEISSVQDRESNKSAKKNRVQRKKGHRRSSSVLLSKDQPSGQNHGCHRRVRKQAPARPRRDRQWGLLQFDEIPHEATTLPDVPNCEHCGAKRIFVSYIAIDRGNSEGDTVSAREYYCYRFQIRDDDESMLLHCLRLLQQFSVDSYVKIETSRLDFHRHRQNVIRLEILQGVLDSVSIGQSEGSKVGCKIVLPSSFIGGPRDMRRRYLDAMALVQKYGKPDIYLTMTCNPACKEIQDNLKYHEKPQDRPNLLARIFRAKFEMLKSEILNKQIFGESKLLNPEYDKVVCAELPDRARYPHLYNLVVKHMIHGPCESMDKTCPCMRDGTCKSHYPKDFCPYTTHVEDGYSHYRKRDDGRKIKVRRFTLDNRWVVPYNPYLLALFDCHINVEICSTIKLVKYLYKYVFKGHDLVSFKVVTDGGPPDIDEINEFQKGRYISPPETFWRIYEFHLNEMIPSVYTLQVHLPNQQFVSFDKNSDLLLLLAKTDFSKTMLTDFFKKNATNASAENLKCFYRDFPQHFVWTAKYKHWTERKRRKVIGRLVSVSPTEGERYYLRLLLTHVPGPTSFDDLLTVNNKKMCSFRDAAFALGLLQSDSFIEETLEEAIAFQMPSSLRLLFATLLVYCSPTNPKMLWEKFESDFSRDYERQQQYHPCSPDEIRGLVLTDINRLFGQMGKNITDYQLVPRDLMNAYSTCLTKEVEYERNISVLPEDILLSSKLNSEQKCAYDLILKACFSSHGHSFFIDGLGGTGKTFLYRLLLVTLRSQGHITIAVATSEIAAAILPGGRIAYSRFKIPLDFSKSKTCQLSKQGSVAKLLSESKLILWDEASMARRETVEAFDDLLKDIMESSLPFGGKVVVFSGDFRQTLPVIEQSTKEVLLQSRFLNSPFWPELHKLKLSGNMRAILDPQFSEFLLSVGEGKEPVDLNDLTLYTRDPYSMICRCILTPKNSSVDELNDILIRRFPGKLYT